MSRIIIGLIVIVHVGFISEFNIVNEIILYMKYKLDVTSTGLAKDFINCVTD